MERVSAELLKKDLSKQIENQVETRVQEELVKQRESEKLYKFKEFTEEDWQQYDKLILYQKLQNILQDFEKQTVVDGLWQDLTPEAKQGPLRKFKVEFDLDKQQIGVSTKATDNDGKPLYEWTLDSNLGQIEHIKRIPIVNPKLLPKAETNIEKVDAKSVPAVPEPFSTKEVEYPAPVDAVYKQQPKEAIVEKVDPTTSNGEPQWDNLESQRDLAFKIVYAFIMFIIATFSLLYAYYKLDKKEQEQQARENRAKGAVSGKGSDRTFFDFLAGQIDDEKDSPHNAMRSLPPQAL